MKLKIEIDTGNAAFGDNDPFQAAQEVTRIIQTQILSLLDDELTDNIDHHLYDINGNKVGHIVVVE